MTLRLFALFAAAAVGLAVVVAAGASPASAAAALWTGAFGSASALADTVNRATPLLLTGLAVALAFRAGVLNIGAEGQMLGGAASAVAVGLLLHSLSPFLAVPLLLLTAALGGAAVGGVAALLRRTRGIPEVLTTILLNFVVEQFVSWLVRGPLQESSRAYPQSDPIAESAMLTRLAPPYSFHAGTLVALAAAPLLGLYLFRTASGFRLRCVGLGEEAARFAGFRPARTAAVALLASAAMAGLAGGIQVAGLTGRLYPGLSGGVGYLAIAVALLGRLHPLGIVAAAFLFGALDAGASEMQRSAGVSAALAQVVQAVALIGIVASEGLSSLSSKVVSSPPEAAR